MSPRLALVLLFAAALVLGNAAARGPLVLQEDGTALEGRDVLNFGSGITCTNSAGSTDCTASGVSSTDWTLLWQQSDLTTTSNTIYTALPDLDWATVAETTYMMRCQFIMTSAGPNNGVQLQIQGPAAADEVIYVRNNYGNTQAQSVDLAAFNSAATDDVASFGSNGRIMDEVLLFFRGADAGNIQMAFQSEAAATSVAIRKGSWCEHRTL